MDFNHIVKKIATEKIDKVTIIAFKGFKYENLENLHNKFFSENGKLIIDDFDFSKLQEGILPLLLKYTTIEKKIYWMTYEELILTYEQIKHFFNILIVNNNLYNKRYPYDNTLSDVSRIYNDFYFNIEEELDENRNLELDSISEFYGGIFYSKNTELYYVTYNDIKLNEVTTIDYYEINEDKVETYIGGEVDSNSMVIELTDDETIFLDATYQLLESSPPRQLHIVTMLESNQLPNNYLQRIHILQLLLKDKTKIYFTKKTVDSIVINNISEYEELLEKYWGYIGFRDLLMYKDVRGSKKELVNISQAQIINDIVEQSTLALKNEPYRDIYITSATGSGKSIMFQIPSLYLTDIYKDEKLLTLIISPLIGLMNDQVESMYEKGIESARTIHSNVTPYIREKIIEEVKSGYVNMLYLSPETLQSRSDIRMLVGDRKIGLVIIDEAHIVTTWGKSFRADYWYLGLYLQKLRKSYHFPIVTFTATAIYGGKEDMYLETRDSLNMINPISYFGNVRRDDIIMCISSSKDTHEAYREYLKTKQYLTLMHIEDAYKRNEKSLVYFPTIKLLNQFKHYLDLNNSEISKVTGIYNGQLLKEEKDEVLTSFKNDQLQFVLATKAFGMGIDIPNVKNVYHYTPSGSVTDYIQEIGRVARDKSKIQKGIAWLNYLPKDFTEVNRLHGMGKITNAQLLAVMQKIKNLYLQNGQNRNLVVSAEDFKNIFIEEGNIDDNNLDNKLKTALLLIEKDFESPNNIGYPPFAARPRTLFGIDYLLVTDQIESELINSSLSKFFRLQHYLTGSYYKAIYTVNLTGIWETYYKHISFPQFKYMLYSSEECKNLKHYSIFRNFIFATGISTRNLEYTEVNNVLSEFKRYVKCFEDFLNEKKRIGQFFSINELGNYFRDRIIFRDAFKAKAIAQAFINSCFEYQKIKNYKFIQDRPLKSDTKYKINNNYDIFIDFLKTTLEDYFNKKENNYKNAEVSIKYYLRTKKDSSIDLDIIVLGLTEALGLISYNVENGNNPQIYIRINSILPLENAIKSNKYYKNQLLANVHNKHYISVEMLKYLFTHQAPGKTNKERILNYTNFFWNTIEDYFLGKIPSLVEVALNKRSFDNAKNT